VEYRRLGNSGLKVSAISVGSWLTFGSRLDESTATALVRTAFERGVNLFDTADVYDRGLAESALGACLDGIPRKDYVLASKVYFPTGEGPNDRGLSRKHIFETVHASLKRLRTDYVDLFQCHRFDDETPVPETVRAFDDLIRQGKIHYWGVSMWSADQIREAVEAASEINAALPISNQPNWSLLDRSIEPEVLPACREHGLGILAFSPLAQGVLTGKYLDGAKPADSRLADERRNVFMGRFLEDEPTARVRQFKALADRIGTTCARLAVAWLMSREGLSSVIVGVTKVSQLEDNLAAVDLKLDEGVLTELDALFS